MTARTQRACASIADLANTGVRAFRAADLMGRDLSIDLRNDGHPAKIVRLAQGTAHILYLADEAHQPIEASSTYEDYVRWATEVGVLRAERRMWQVNWSAGRPDGNVVLVGATDGTDVCRFRTVWRIPTFILLPDAEPRQASTYRALLLGQGSAPPSASLDLHAVWAASVVRSSNSQKDWWSLSLPLHEQSWLVRLMNDWRLLTLTKIEFSSGAGSGCDHTMLGLVNNGHITAAGLGQARLPNHPPLAAISPALERELKHVWCSGVTETPLLDQKRRAYVLLDNVAGNPDTIVDRVRLLASVRKGTMRALARLSWKARNVALRSFN